MKVVSVLRFISLDKEGYPPILERLRGLEVLEGSAHEFAKNDNKYLEL